MGIDYGFSSGGMFAEPLGVGRDGGAMFTECRIEIGLFVKKPAVWCCGWALQAVQLIYTDGSVGPLYGTSRHSYNENTFAPTW